MAVSTVAVVIVVVTASAKRRAFIGSSLMEVQNMLENSLKTRSKNGIDRLTLALPPDHTKQNREVLMP